MTEITLPQSSRTGPYLAGPSENNGAIQIEAIVSGCPSGVGEVETVKREFYL